MVHQSIIHARLNHLGVRLSRWYQPELKELSLLLMDHEEIVSVVAGRYYGGYALLVATGQRLLLIDKKTMFMSLEDIRYDMISEIDYRSRLFDASITIFTVNKQHRFTSVKHKSQMRHLTLYSQKRIMEIRQPQSTMQLARQLDDEQTNSGYSQEPVYRQENQYPSHPAREHRVLSHMPHVPLPSPRQVSAHLRAVGTSAIHGAHLSAINPYTRASLTTKRNWSGIGHASALPPQEPVRYS